MPGRLRRPVPKKKTVPVFILASSSPRRRALLRQAGLAFRVLPARYDEGPPRGDPGRFASAAAKAKAVLVGRRCRRPAWILAADTLVAQGKNIFGKPRSRAQARRTLQRLSGREHTVFSGVSLYHSGTGRHLHWVEKTKVCMRAIGQTELDDYLDSGEWKDKAGAYGIQGRAGAFITKVKGCYFNVVGLPLGKVCAAMRRAGVY
ncbi:septum formation protein Maf [candidate division FCPU426 bacterium]|nr:septum formation protein Maf [candidate division FCPU426 bacterium]